MINQEIVYKIKLIALADSFCGGDAWAKGTNIYRRGGSGKTWTNKKLADKSLEEIKAYKCYGVDFKAELVTFKLTEITTK